MEHLSLAQLNGGFDVIRQSPLDGGVVRLIVRRPEIDGREILAQATLAPDVGVVGDNWRAKGSSSTEDGMADPRAQVTVTNWRGMSLIAGTAERVALAGDQLYLDLDLSEENLPAGTKLRIGTAVLEVSAKPHRGCAKFSARFGVDAVRFVNTGEGLQRRLRGINTRVVEEGIVQVGDVVKVDRPA